MRYCSMILLVLSFCSFASDSFTGQSSYSLMTFLLVSTLCAYLLFKTKNLNHKCVSQAEEMAIITSLLKQKNEKPCHTCVQLKTSPTKSASTVSITDKDQLFVDRFKAIVSKYYHHADFNRTMAASLMAISERQLNRKLSLLTEHNFSHYLRQYRLDKAQDLLGKGLQVSQIGDQVGFSSSTYFSACFKNQFGKSVKQYEQQKLAEH